MHLSTTEGIIDPAFIAELDEYDGISPDEIANMTSDIFADMSEAERADYERELEEENRWKAAELRHAEREAATFRQGLRENILDQYDTAENYFHAVGTASDADYIARLFGLGTNWLEPKNCERRKSTRVRNARRETDAHRAKAYTCAPVMQTATKTETVSQKPAESPEIKAKDRVRAMYAASIEKHPHREKKLTASLAFQMEQFDTTIARHVAIGKSQNEAVAIWEKAARAAMEAKIK